MNKFQTKIKELVSQIDHGFYHTRILPNMVRINDFRELARTNIGVYSPLYELKAKPILTSEGGDVHSGTVWMYHDGKGLFFSNAWEDDFRGPLKKLNQKNELAVRFYKFSICDHDMVFSSNLGTCYNRYKCTKCSYTQDIDSSD